MKKEDKKERKSLVKRFLEGKLSNKPILKKEPRATIVLDSSPTRSKYFKDEFDKEKKNLLAWK